MTVEHSHPELSRKVRRQIAREMRESKRPAREIAWKYVEWAYTLGYADGHEDQMQMRIRDAMERDPDTSRPRTAVSNRSAGTGE